MNPPLASSNPPPHAGTSLPRWQGIGAALLALLLIVAAFWGDRPVRQLLLEHQAAVAAAEQTRWNRTSEHRLWGAISKYGDWPQLMLIGGGLLGLALWRKRADWTRVIVAALLASTLAGILANASRLTTGRTRPRAEATHGAGFYGPWSDGRWTIGVPDRNSFPSGHTATAVGFAAPFLFAKPLLGIPLILGALAIGLSRMQLGAHHLSDVVVSILLALAVGWWVLRWVQLHGSRSWVIILTRLGRPPPAPKQLDV